MACATVCPTISSWEHDRHISLGMCSSGFLCPNTVLTGLESHKSKQGGEKGVSGAIVDPATQFVANRKL